MSFRRGFKAEAERIAEGLRSDAGITGIGPADLDAIAGTLNARILAADTLVPRSRLLELRAIQEDAFFACTITLPNESVVVFNPLCERARQRSDIAHELAHLALNHPLRRTERVDAFTFFTCDPDQEAEANWLGGALLLPRSVLVRLARRKSPEEIAEMCQVTLSMATFRLHSTGVALQLGREGRPAIQR